jgi:hypothetical protein
MRSCFLIRPNSLDLLHRRRAGGPTCNSPPRQGRDRGRSQFAKVRRTGTRSAIANSIAALALVAFGGHNTCAQQAKPRPKTVATDQDKQTLHDTRVKVTISKETTHITEPLRPDGYPDYARYVDQRLSKGVTPDNNAAVLLLRAIGPLEIPEVLQAEFFKRLAIEPLPSQGDYLVDWATFSRRIPAKEWPAVPADRPVTAQEYLQSLDEVARSQPWKRDNFPAVARWLETYARQIDLLVAASKRPKTYAPAVREDDDKLLLMAILPLAQNSRMAARALVTRAMYRAGSGDPDKAVDDLMACHRLARLTGEGFTLLEGLVAVSVNQMALEAEKVMIAREVFSAKQRSRLRTELGQLAPLPSMADRLDQGERIVYLDALCAMARGITNVIEQGGDDSASSVIARALAEQTLGAAIDWNIPLKAGNEWYDRIAKIGRIDNRVQQLQQLELLEKDIKALAESTKRPKLVLSAILAPRATASQQISNVLISLLLPAMNAAFTAERRDQTMQSLVILGLALADYRDLHQRFPDRLDQLAPKHIDRVPLDAMWGEPLTYKRTEAGYVLYALGRNGQDDGGSTSDTGDGPLDFVLAVPQKMPLN